MSKRGMKVTKQMRSERRRVAESMKQEYDKLSLAEKLAALPEGGAKKQRARLEAAIKAAEDAKASKSTDTEVKKNKKNKN